MKKGEDYNDRRTQSEASVKSGPAEKATIKGLKTKRRTKAAIVLGITGALCLGLAGYFVSAGYKTVSVPFLAASFITFGVALYIQLRNHAASRRHAGMCSFIVVSAGLIVCAGLLWMEARKEQYLSGVLIPGNDPTPPLPRDPPPEVQQAVREGAMCLFLGDSVAVTRSLPHVVLTYKGKEMLTISSNAGGMTISAEFFGDNGNVVAVLRSNRFTINHLNYFERERPDRSSSIVRDQKNMQVVNVRFLNPRAIKLLGRIRFPDAPDLVIDEHELTLMAAKFHRTLFTSKGAGTFLVR
jgi:hypothetical protein